MSHGTEGLCSQPGLSLHEHKYHKGVGANPALAGPTVCQFNKINEWAGAMVLHVVTGCSASSKLLLGFTKLLPSAGGVVRRQVVS